MKIIVVMPVKNEEWILEKSLKAASFFADHIIVADQNSTDRTSEICKRFPKVIYIKNPSEKFNERERRKILLSKVREFYGNNLVFALDADEILTANILKPKILEKLVKQIKPGMSVILQWIMVWKNPFQYRYDNLPKWRNNWKHFVYWDDRKMSFDNTKIHSARVPKDALSNSIKFEDIKVLHYQFVSWSRMVSKQRFYQITEYLLYPKKSALKISPKYKWYLKKGPDGIILRSMPDVWIKPWQERGIDLGNFSESKLYWFDAEILQDFKKYGTEHFKWLDIWDVDWEKKRQIAIKRGIKELPDNEIKDPRPFYIKFYHKYLQLLLGYDSFLYKIYRFLKRSRLSNLSRSFLTFKRK